MFIKLTNSTGDQELINATDVARVTACNGNNGENSRVILKSGPNLHYMETIEEIDALIQSSLFEA